MVSVFGLHFDNRADNYFANLFKNFEMKEFEVEVNKVIYTGNWWFDYMRDVTKIDNVTVSVETENGWEDADVTEPKLLAKILDKVEEDYEDDIAVEQEEAKWERWNANQECLREE